MKVEIEGRKRERCRLEEGKKSKERKGKVDERKKIRRKIMKRER